MKRILLSAFLGFAFALSALAGGTIVWPQPPLPPDVNPAATPSAPLIGWLNHFQQVLEASRKTAKIDLIFDGDTYAITGNPKGDHGGFWSPRYEKLNAFEFTNPGDPTQTVLWRLQNGQVDGLHPKLVVLLTGGSNVQPNTPEQIAEGVKAVVQEYRKRCPEATILLMGIFPRQEKPDAPFRVKIKAANQLLSALGDGKKVIFLDIGDKFLQPDGTMTKEILCDFNFPRPSAQAYKIWADAIQPVIDQVFSPAGTATVAASATPLVRPQPSPSTVLVGGTVTWPQPPLPPGGNSAVIPAPPLARLNSFQQAIDDARKLPKVDIIFDGDSITAAWRGGAGGVWNKRFAKYNPVGFGVSGDSTQGLLWRVECGGQVDGLHPKLVVLLIGTNNMNSCSAEQIAGGIKADIEAYRKHCPEATVLVLGILPRGEKPTEPLRAKVKEVNKIVATFADGKKVLFLDFGDKLLNPDGTFTPPMTNDFLHPCIPGYEIWADSIQPVIDQIFPPTSQATPQPK